MLASGLGFRLLALAAAVSALALVAVGGVVRITESGLGCPDWPLCNGGVVPHGKAPAIEYSHRTAAAAVTALVLLTAAWALWRQRGRREVVVPAVVAALLVPGQALLGAVVVWLELPGWIVGVHFVVGMLFLAATIATAVAAWTGPPWRQASSPGFVRLAWTAALAGLLLVAAGATVVSAHADGACGRQWPACNGAFVAGGSHAAIQVVHRTLAYAVAALALALALAVGAWRGRGPRLLGALPLAAVLAQLGFGISLVLSHEGSRAHQILAGLHVAGAGIVWASLVVLALVGGRPARRAPAGFRFRPHALTGGAR